MSVTVPVAPRGEPFHHIVQFYEGDGFLCGRVADFIAEGVTANEPAVVIATDDHRRGITATLSARGIDATNITFADAHAVLAAFTVDGRLDENLFRATVGGILGDTHGRVRVYGEIVDILCRTGQPEAALQLEGFWNSLGCEVPISLLCGYTLEDFQHATDAHTFEGVCTTHSVVVPAEGFADEEDDRRRREVARLQQRANALEAEIDARAFLLDAVTALHRSLDVRERAEELAALVVSRIAAGCTIVAGQDTITNGKTSVPTLTLPIEIGGRSLGTLSLHGARCHESVAFELARHAAIAFENARLYEVARDANRAKDEFLATLSHELRTPLTAIFGWARMLAMGLDEPTTRTAIEVIEQSAATQAALVDDLLDVSRIVSGKLVMGREPFDLRTTVENAAQTVRLAAESRRIAIEVAPCDQPAILIGDATRVQQIVWNLLGNAVKFSSPGGKVRVAVTCGPGEVTIAVQDEGCGIAPEFLAHVFEPFRQADSATTRAYGGLGLGLAIVKYVTELHGGTVAVSSEGVGRGATFAVTLPLADR
ncbi:MAG TPA: ATP-binding protein [Thermoanaerobaculia bacterium]|nr:ATP-binding protein [Thermoanaerobaculia bacterium]